MNVDLWGTENEGTKLGLGNEEQLIVGQRKAWTQASQLEFEVSLPFQNDFSYGAREWMRERPLATRPLGNGTGLDISIHLALVISTLAVGSNCNLMKPRGLVLNAVRI